MDSREFLRRLRQLEEEYGSELIQIHEMIDGTRRYYFQSIKNDDQHTELSEPKEQAY